MSLPDVARALRERWVTVVAVILLALAAGGALYALRPPTYTATLTVYAAPRPTDPVTTTPEASYQGSLLAKERIPSYLQLATSPQVLSQVITRARLDESVSGLTSRITPTSAADSVLIDIAVQAPTAGQAVGIAEAMAQVLPPAVDQLEQSGAPGIAPVSLRVIRPIPVPDRPSTPGLGLTLGLALLAGVVLGVAIALVRDALDRSLRTADGLGAAVGLPVLGSLPDRGGRRTGPELAQERSPLGEAYRQLRTGLHSAATEGTRHVTPGVLVVTSPGSAEGRTSAVVNLAVAAAGAGMSVLVVDADLRRPHAARLLAVDRSAGLTDVLAGTDAPGTVIRSSPHGVDVLATGPLPSNPAELLAGGALSDLFEELAERYALVLVDVPPLLPVTDAAVVAAAADGAVVLARRGTTARDDVAAAVRTLETAGAHVVGTVLVADPDHRIALPDTGERRTTITPRRPAPRAAVRALPTPAEPPPAPLPASTQASAPAQTPAARPSPAPHLAPAPPISPAVSPPPPRQAPAPTRSTPAARPTPAPATRGGPRAHMTAADEADVARTETVAPRRASQGPAAPARPSAAPSSQGRTSAAPSAAPPVRPVTNGSSPSRTSAAPTRGTSAALPEPLPEPRNAPSGPTPRHRQPDAGGAGGAGANGAEGGDGSLLDFRAPLDSGSVRTGLAPDATPPSRGTNGRNAAHRSPGRAGSDRRA